MIALRDPTEVLYRPHGQHDYVPGAGRTLRVAQVNVRRTYCRRPAAITNLCGRFLCCFYHHGREGILIANGCFGGHQHMHHVDGMMQVHGPQIHFKGAQGVETLERMAAAAGLLDAGCRVYMCVCNMEMGKGAHTTADSCLAARVRSRIAKCRLVRPLCVNNLQVLFRTTDFEQWGEVGFPAGAVPSSADLQVSHYGGVVVRITWADPCEWGPAVEAAALAFSQWVGDAVAECC